MVCESYLFAEALFLISFYILRKKYHVRKANINVDIVCHISYPLTKK